jgi:hypothetical protein
VLCQEAVRLMKPPLLKPPQELAALCGPPPTPSASCAHAHLQLPSSASFPHEDLRSCRYGRCHTHRAASIRKRACMDTSSPRKHDPRHAETRELWHSQRPRARAAAARWRAAAACAAAGCPPQSAGRPSPPSRLLHRRRRAAARGTLGRSWRPPRCLSCPAHASMHGRMRQRRLRQRPAA